MIDAYNEAKLPVSDETRGKNDKKIIISFFFLISNFFFLQLFLSI